MDVRGTRFKLWRGLILTLAISAAFTGLPISQQIWAATATVAPTPIVITVVVTATPPPATLVPTLPPLPKAKTATPLPSQVNPTATNRPRTTLTPTVTAVRPTRAATRIAPTATKATSGSLPALPKAATATSAPLVPVAVTITNERATALASEAMAKEALPISDVQAAFTQQHIRITGKQTGNELAPIEILGVPVIESETIRFQLVSLKRNGLELPLFRQEVETAIDDIFRREFLGQRVQSATLGDGTLTVTVMMKQE